MGCIGGVAFGSPKICLRRRYPLFGSEVIFDAYYLVNVQANIEGTEVVQYPF
jgi:hypothetical protein